MNTKDNHETNDQAIVIEDLGVQNDEAIQGGIVDKRPEYILAF